MSKVSEIEDQIKYYAGRLAEVPNGESEDSSKRIRKRINQRLGKLKKELAALQENGVRKIAPVDDRLSNDTSSRSQQGQQPPSRKELKLKLRILNQELSDCAQKKNLKFAKKRFNWALKRGLPDVHTYTNMINVHARCQDIQGAEKLLHDMIAHGIPPNIVAYTAFLKGCCEVGDMHKARELYFNDLNPDPLICPSPSPPSLKEKLRPNTRTLNAFLRGCCRTGAVKSAIAAFALFQSQNSASAVQTAILEKGVQSSEYVPDVSSYEYLIGILCRAGHWKEAEGLLELLSASNSKVQVEVAPIVADVLQNPAMYVSLSNMAALMGRYAVCERWVRVAERSLAASAVQPLREAMRQKFQSVGNSDNGLAAALGGSSRSTVLFQAHRRRELETQLQLIEECAAAVTSTVVAKNAAEDATSSAEGICSTCALPEKTSQFAVDLSQQLKARLVLLQALSQLLSFGFDGQGDFDGALSSKDIRALLASGASAGTDDGAEVGSQTTSHGRESTTQDSIQSNKRRRLETKMDKSSGGVLQRFRFGAMKDLSAPDDLRQCLVFALRDKFGLDAVRFKDGLPVSAGAQNREGSEAQESQQLFVKTANAWLRQARDEVISKIVRAVSIQTQQLKQEEAGRKRGESSGERDEFFIDFEQLFGIAVRTSHWAQSSSRDGNDGPLEALGRGVAASGPAASLGQTSHHSGTMSSSNPRIPIKLEICSGNGEWVVAQAAADWRAVGPHRNEHSLGHGQGQRVRREPRALWVALELRCDRVHNILSQHLLSNPFFQEQYSDLADRLAASCTERGKEGEADSLKSLEITQEPSISESFSYPLGTPVVNNLAVIGGDAMHVLTHHFPAGGISEIFINHPQPPEREHGQGSERGQGAHLLSAQFFAQMHRVLAKDGTLTILTDNLPYAQSLARTVADLARTTSSTSSTSADSSSRSLCAFMCAAPVEPGQTSFVDSTLQESIPLQALSQPSQQSPAAAPAVRVWRGSPGPEAGHVVPASSYFDRMWTLGQKKRRWFIFLKKVLYE